jgi:hypothetical protein
VQIPDAKISVCYGVDGMFAAFDTIISRKNRRKSHRAAAISTTVS